MAIHTGRGVSLMPAPSADEVCRETILQSIYQSLRRIVRDGITLEVPLTVRVRDDLYSVIVVIAPADQCASCPLELTCRNHPPDGEPDSIRERICQVLTIEPQTRARVARLAGCKLNSHFRQIVADMIRESLILDTPDGIKITDSS